MLKNKWGFTFSTVYCEELGLDSRTVASEILKDFNFSSVRLCAYWNRIELEQGKFDYSEIDALINIFSKLEITLALGLKVPRWPEFHTPGWTDNLTADEFNRALLNFVENISSRYSKSKNIKYFQVENEPLFKFGVSNRKLDKELLKKEVEIVKKNSNKEIILTETGELRDWVEVSELADRVGINLYSVVYNGDLGRYFNLTFTSNYYKKKANKLKTKVFVAELQAEPWGPGRPEDRHDVKEWYKSINPKQLVKNSLKAVNSGFEEVWFWGVEWWYFSKTINPEIFQTAKKIVNDKDFLSNEQEVLKQEENRKLLTKVSLLLGVIILLLTCILISSILRS